MVIKKRKKGKPFKYYSYKDLVKEVAEMTDVVSEDIEFITKAMEEALVKHLMEATEEEDVEVEYFKGIRVISRFSEGHYMNHPCHGEVKNTYVPTRLLFSARFTDWFRNKRVEDYRAARKIFDDWARVSEAQYSQDANLIKEWKEKRRYELTHLDYPVTQEKECKQDRSNSVTTAE